MVIVGWNVANNDSYSTSTLILPLIVPPGAPGDVMYDVVGTTVQIEWTEPNDVGQPENITYYVIVTSSGTNAVLEYATTNTTITLPCRDFNSSTSYTFFIASTNPFYTDVNSANSSDEFSFTTTIGGK